MTVPIDYTQAEADFERFMLDLRDTLNLQTTHQAWGTLLGVFETFRRRLQPDAALRFAKALPPLLRAAFVQDWNFQPEVPSFSNRAELDAEVMNYHRDHQFAAPGCIAGTAAALWRHVDGQRLKAALAEMPADAREFWHVEGK